MILLEIESAIIRNLLERSLDPNEVLSESYNCCDFDGVSFTIKFIKPKSAKKSKENDEETPNKFPVLIEMKLSCYDKIKDYGADEYYQKTYGKFISEPSPGYTHAISFNLHEMNPEEQKNAIHLACRIKSNILGAPIMWVANLVESKQSFAPFEIPYRSNTGESIFIVPTDSGAAAIFTIRFSDPGDRVIGGVFLSELIAARTKVPSAPVVSISDKPPGDLSQFDLPKYITENSQFAFVSILLSGPQLSARKREDISYYIPMFRNYIHYHIKCTKGFLHSKMRNRVNNLLRILDNARPEPKVKVARTVTGKVIGQRK